MAYTTKLSLLALIVLLAVSGQALAGRQLPLNSKDIDVKQPEFLFKSDRSFLIPGIGRVLVPPHPYLSIPHPHLSIPSYSPPASIGGGSYIPGGDDTFVPNPGFETPNPGRAGSVPAPAHP
ncbi:putative cell wall protein [Ricinus communis]|uniref:Cell wall protein n=1 Tax=Ricinus communis TaxID=3988 RepID=B9RW42_RICCO|nr:putative cell wall protein [Ricinus communis]EEF44479.1 conserved hypothetical protein [Ricinus communis]|eukprot:XP_002517961.1 putative cell wall protein [Ricinus communis]